METIHNRRLLRPQDPRHPHLPPPRTARVPQSPVRHKCPVFHRDSCCRTSPPKRRRQCGVCCSATPFSLRSRAYPSPASLKDPSVPSRISTWTGKIALKTDQVHFSICVVWILHLTFLRTIFTNYSKFFQINYFFRKIHKNHKKKTYNQILKQKSM